MFIQSVAVVRLSSQPQETKRPVRPALLSLKPVIGSVNPQLLIDSPLKPIALHCSWLSGQFLLFGDSSSVQNWVQSLVSAHLLDEMTEGAKFVGTTFGANFMANTFFKTGM